MNRAARIYVLTVAAFCVWYSVAAWPQAFGPKVQPELPPEMLEPLPGLQCQSTENVAKYLRTEHHQRVVVDGIGSSGRTMMEIYASDGGARWTIVASDTGGDACIVYRGTGLRIHDGLKANYMSP